MQGNPIDLINSAGTVVVRYTYDAWGKPISTTGSMASSLGKLNPFRYRGYVYDEETELYYLRSRYYNPAWCRFINMDSVLVKGLLSTNQQAYCINNPVLHTDSNGRNFIEDIWNLFCDTVEANQEIAQYNAQAEHDALQVTGDLLVDAIYENQRLKQANIQAEHQANKKAVQDAWNILLYITKENQKIAQINAQMSYDFNMTVMYKHGKKRAESMSAEQTLADNLGRSAIGAICKKVPVVSAVLELSAIYNCLADYVYQKWEGNP